jgi:hypothetical protein
MAKIVDPDDLNQGTEVVIDTTARTIALLKTGNLSDDGVALQTFYSFLKEEWRTDNNLIKFPFPMIPITDEQMDFVDNWDLLDSTSRLLIRDGGWSVQGAAAEQEYMNVTTLGAFDDSNVDLAYYIQTADQTDVAYFNLTGEVNQAVQIFGDSDNGNFNYRGYFKIFLREEQKTYASYNLLTEQNLSILTYRKYAIPLTNGTDIKVTHTDAQIEGDSGTYGGITVTYYGTPQSRIINGVPYDFSIIIDANNKSKEVVYEKVQYLLRQQADIDSGGGFWWGQTADEMLSFIGDDLYTQLTSLGGVYIDNYTVGDTNSLFFADDAFTGTYRSQAFIATGAIAFNDNIQDDADAKYWMFFTSVPQGDYGTESAIIVEDATAVQITGDVNAQASIDFTFDYDNNAQGGRTPVTAAPVTVVAIGLLTAQFVKVTSTLARTKTNNISVVAPLERNYSNPY